MPAIPPLGLRAYRLRCPSLKPRLGDGRRSSHIVRRPQRAGNVRAFRNERQESWFAGLEGAFRHFGGVTEEVLFDNDCGLVVRHDWATREVEFNTRPHAFAAHWRFWPRACAPYRARTKGKDERGVGYVKKNAVAGRRFVSWSAFEAHLDAWTRDIADQRVHGTTGEVPIERFRRTEAGALRAIVGIPPFAASRELVRKVHADCAIEVDGTPTPCHGG
jgi:hypothetical protein